MAWAKLVTNTTDSSPTSYTTTIPTGDEKTFNQILNHDLIDPTTLPRMQLGDGSVNTGSVYADRWSVTGGSDNTDVSKTFLLLSGNSEAINIFNVIYMINISGEEKLGILFHVNNKAAGATNAPLRTEIVFKMAYTSGQLDTVHMLNSNTDTYDDDSNTSILGTD